MKKKILYKSISYALCSTMLMTNIIPVFATTTLEQSTSNETDSKETEVLYNKSASYFVTIPKTISLGSDKTSLYSVKVDGDIPSDREVYVSPIDEITSRDGFNFYMKDQNTNNPKDDVIADVTQSKFYWNYEYAANAYVETNNNVTALDLSSGTWKGTFDFEINMHKMSGIKVTATNEDGENINATASEIIGSTKEQLLNSLEETGLITSQDEVNALIEIESDDFEGIANTTFEVSSIAQTGDKVAILHYNDNNEWELIGIETVDDNCIITGDFTSYSPVAFVKVKDDGSFETISNVPITLVAGLYDANDNLLVTWEDSGIDIEKDYVYFTRGNSEYDGTNYYKTSTTSGYYVLTNNYPTTTKVVMPNTIANIGNCCFYECKNLINIDISNSINNIGSYTFFNCENLTSIIIPNNVITIKDYAFYNTNLTNIKIGNGLTNIGNYAFGSCKNLTKINVDINNPNYISKNNVLFSKDMKSLIQYPIGIIDTFYEIPNGVTSIEFGAFSKCDNLTNITIPNSVINIGNNAFFDCINLNNITIPNSVTNIGNSAFYNNKSLSNLIIGNNVTNIGDYAFSSCVTLKNVIIPNNVIRIGTYAFNGCSNLTNIIIPSNVNNIGFRAFSGCSNLTNVIFEEPSNWYISNFEGQKTTAISNSDLSNSSTAATYLTSTYIYYYWTR